MKTLFLSALLLCTLAITTAQAQYNSFTINNNTSCDIFVVFYGTTATAFPPCQANYRSNIVQIPAGSSMHYTDPSPSSVPGGLDDGWGTLLGSSDNFTRVRVYHGPPSVACISLGSVNMSDCTAGGSTFTSPFVLEQYTGTCSTCYASASISWMVYSPTHAGIDIN